MVEGPQALSKAQRLKVLLKKKFLQLYLYKKNGVSTSSASSSTYSITSDSTNQLDGRAAQSEIRESTLQQVDCIGKEVFLVFEVPPDNETKFILRLHFGMNGSERICDCDRTILENLSAKIVEDMAGRLMPPRSRKKLTAALVLQEDGASPQLLLLWDSNVSLKSAAYLRTAQSRRNQDIMQHEVFDSALVQRLLSQDGREIYEAIMDQEVLPGVGNVIKCEGLFNAGVHPYSIAKLIPTDTLAILIEKLKKFAYDWYISKQRHRDIVKNIYGLDRCGRCLKDVRLVRSGVLQRITYYCETCQRLYTATTTTSSSSCSSSSNGIDNDTNAICSGANSRFDHNNRSNNNSNSYVDSNSTAEELYLDLNLTSARITKWKCKFCEYLNMVSDLDDSHNDKQYECTICGEAWNIVTKKINSSSDGFINETRSAVVPGNPSTIGEIKRKRVREEGEENDDNKDMLQASIGGRLPFLIAPLCKCRAECALTRVRKSGPTMHRLFWACRRSGSGSCGSGGSNRNSNGKCDYFNWADGLFPKCPRHNVVCILRRVLKDGPNNGRYFFSCSSSRGNSATGNAATAKATVCNTFIWAEAATATATRNGVQDTTTTTNSNGNSDIGPKRLKASQSIVIPL